MERLKKILKKAAVFLLVLVGLVLFVLLAGNIFVRLSVKKRIISVQKAAELSDVDCILVLGAAVKPNYVPSLMLEDRLIKGVELYKAGVSPRMLMSGDHSDEYYDEVTTMKLYAIDSGVPSEDIFLDHAGLSTYESMYRAKYVYGAKRVVIVTQRYHMYRALYVAKKLGLDAYGVVTDKKRYSGQLKRDVREYFATIKDIAKAVLKPASTVVGEPIPLTGSGDLTN